MTFWLLFVTLCDFEAELLDAVNRKLVTVSKAYALSDTQKKWQDKPLTTAIKYGSSFQSP